MNSDKKQDEASQEEKVLEEIPEVSQHFEISPLYKVDEILDYIKKG